jgi:hypothetical protein
MFIWAIKISILSVVFIFLVHYLINFFKNNLTVPKIKDLVNVSTQKYDKMYNVIGNQHSQPHSSRSEQHTTNKKEDPQELGYTDFDLLPQPNSSEENESMKDELKLFLKTQLNTFS